VFGISNLLDDFFYRRVAALGVGVIDRLGDITLQPGWWVEVIGEVGKLIESGPGRSPFCQPTAVILKVTPADMKRKEARDDRIWIPWDARREPIRGI